jgi:hypothetical protein
VKGLSGKLAMLFKVNFGSPAQSKPIQPLNSGLGQVTWYSVELKLFTRRFAFETKLQFESQAPPPSLLLSHALDTVSNMRESSSLYFGSNHTSQRRARTKSRCHWEKTQNGVRKTEFFRPHLENRFRRHEFL